MVYILPETQYEHASQKLRQGKPEGYKENLEKVPNLVECRSLQGPRDFGKRPEAHDI